MEIRQEATIELLGVQFVVIDSPGAGADDTFDASLVQIGEGQPKTAPMKLPDLDAGASLLWIFISGSNSFVRIAARDLNLGWCC